MGIKQFFKDVKETAKEVVKDCILKKIGDTYINFSDILTLTSFGEDFAEFNKKTFYAVEITGSNNIRRVFTPLKNIAIDVCQGENSGELWVFLTKNKIKIDKEFFASKNSVYVFSKNRELIEKIADFFEVKLLNGEQIVKAVFDISGINVYYSDDEDYSLKIENIDYDSPAYIDPIGCAFKKFYAEGVYNRILNYSFYQFIGNKTFLNDLDIQELFKFDWDGYLAFYFQYNHSSVENKIRFITNDVKKFEKDKKVKKEFIKFDNLVNSKEDNYEIIYANAAALINNDKEVSNIANLLRTSYLKKEIFKKKLIYKTPLLARDIDFDFFTVIQNSKPFIASVFKNKPVKTKNPAVTRGRDLNGSYVTYSFSESASPHFFIFSKTRSGKSFFLQKMTSGILRYDLEKNKVKNRNCYIRYFDKGNSAVKFVKRLQGSDFENEIISVKNVKNLRFSFLDIDVKNFIPDFEDVNFSIIIMNMYLEIANIEPFNAIETAEIKEAINSVFLTGYQGISLYSLKEDKAFTEILLKLFQKYPELNAPFAKTTDVPADSEFSFLNKPRLIDIIRYLEVKYNSSYLDDITKNSINSALVKLKALNSNKLFNNYASFSLNGDKKFFYFDIDELKELGEKEFIPAFWFLFQKLYRKDKKRGKKSKDKGVLPTPVYYYLEEAHNYMGFESFRNMFKEFSREAAKYNIHLGFISQYASDLPAEVFNSLGSKIILPPRQIEDILKDINNMWQDKPEYIEYYKKRAKKFYAVISYDGGLFTLNQKISKEEEWLFNSEQ